MTSYLNGAAYVLGEEELDHADVTDLAERAARYQLLPKPQLWGWGTVRRTRRPLAELAAAAGRAALSRAGLAASEVPALVLCSSSVSEPAEDHGAFFADVLTGIGLGPVPHYGLALNRCTNLLAGLDLADALVRAGRYPRVLVVTADRVLDERERLVGYAIFSDAAAAVVVDGRPAAGGFELLGCASAQDTAALPAAAEISAELARQVTDRLLAAPGLKPDELCAVLTLNIFRPLVMVKERQAGSTADQLYLDNISRIGHCYAADPLINLLDRGSHPGHHYLLAASVPGSRHGALVRRLED